jgi:hypothetical protein
LSYKYESVQAADIRQSLIMAEATDTSELYEQNTAQFPETHGAQVCTSLDNYKCVSIGQHNIYLSFNVCVFV